MSAGLPALGLGGMFYMLLIVWMVLRALTRRATNDASHPSRWRFIGKMVVIGLLMVLAAFAEALFIRGVLDLTVAFIPGSAKFVYTTSISFALFMLTIPFILLLLLIGGVHFLRLLMNRRQKLEVEAALAG